MADVLVGVAAMKEEEGLEGPTVLPLVKGLAEGT